MEIHFRILRKKIRESQRAVMDIFVDDHKINLCFFCGARDNLTREHMMPQWVFEKKPEKFFSATINEMPQPYIKSTIPACAYCNNVLLSSVEERIIDILQSKEPGDYDFQERDMIIWWLELIGFKLQVLDLRQKFIKVKDGPYVPFLADLPLGIMRRGGEESPYRILLGVRAARRKLFKKTKIQEGNSLVIFETSNPDMHFFHKSGEFIFIELPKFKSAFFYFFNKQFDSVGEASKLAKELIEKVY
ncbi:hypothetical protein WKH53_23350 [Pantoea agglomerans]|uniref:hypothetical protein n=1 Tax=Enterobacter agglomerans TaxID=549 RepID=UPI003C7B7E18